MNDIITSRKLLCIAIATRVRQSLSSYFIGKLLGEAAHGTRYLYSSNPLRLPTAPALRLPLPDLWYVRTGSGYCLTTAIPCGVDCARPIIIGLKQIRGTAGRPSFIRGILYP
jgi:hypothetical protein